MKKLLALFLLFAAPAALAQQLPVQTPIPLVGPGFDPSNPVFNFNSLIQQINNFLVPTFQQQGGYGFLQFVAGTQGQSSPTIRIVGGSPNASIRIQPSGNGDVILFPANASALSQGHLKFGNVASFVPAPGLAGCAGTPAGRPASFTMNDHITGYLIFEDWLDRPHGIPAC